MIKLGRQTADLILAIVIGITFLAAAVAALFMPWQAAVLPLMISMLGVGLSAALAVSLYRGPHLTEGSLLKPKDGVMFLWFVGAASAVTVLGFEIGGLLFALAYFRLAAGFTWRKTLALALPVPLVAWLAFEVLLGQVGFDGLLLESWI